jgi:hypothetical protein
MARSTLRSSRGSRAPSIRRLLVADALSTWLVPALSLTVLALAVLLSAFGLITDGGTAATAGLALLVVAAFVMVTPWLGAQTARRRISLPWLLGGAALWIALLYYPLHCRIFAGPPLAKTRLDASAIGTILPVAGHGSRLDLIVDAHLPLAAEQRDRSVHYDFDLVDERGDSTHYTGELGDRWRTRRMGRRGTAPSHYEHLSTDHAVDNPSGSNLRLDRIVLTGEPAAALTASVYARRSPPASLLYTEAAVLTLLALAFDLWAHPQDNPVATLMTASAAGTLLTFVTSGAGHPGFRDLIGAAIVGSIAGVALGAVVMWIARNVLPRSNPGKARRLA